MEHRAHLQLDPGQRAALRLPLPARHGLQLRGVRVRGRQRLRPIVRQLRGRPGRLKHFQAPGLPNQTAGTVDVYGLQILDATLETGNTAETASALLLKHEFLDGGADDVTLATLGEVLLEPTLTTLGNFLVRSNSQSSVASASFAVGGFQLEGGCQYRLGTASNLVMYVSAADNDYVGVTGTFLGTPAQGVWSTARLDFSVPPGGIAKLHFGAFGGSIPGLVQQSAGTLDLYSMQIRASAFEGESVSVTDLLADSLALTGSATLDGLTAQRNAGCDQLLCNDVNCTDVFTTGVDASGAVSCAALTATGTVAGAALSSTGGVSGCRRSSSKPVVGRTLAPEVRLLQQGRRTRPDSWPAWSPSAPSSWPSASRHREASPCQACRAGWTPEDGAAASWWACGRRPTSLPLFRVEARRGGRRQEAELGPRGATPSKRNLCPGTCRPPPCKGTPVVLLRTHPGPCGGTRREPERGCCCGRRERPCSS